MTEEKTRRNRLRKNKLTTSPPEENQKEELKEELKEEPKEELKEESNYHLLSNPIGAKCVTLCTMQPKKPGKICGLDTKNPGILQKLMAMGILPGMPITLLKKSPSYFFEVDQTRYAVDKEIANHIYVSY